MYKEKRKENKGITIISLIITIIILLILSGIIIESSLSQMESKNEVEKISQGAVEKTNTINNEIEILYDELEKDKNTISYKLLRGTCFVKISDLSITNIDENIISKYAISYKQSTSENYENTINTTNSEATVIGLKDNESYKIKITAIDTNGEEIGSRLITAKTKELVCDEITLNHISDNTKYISSSWSADSIVATLPANSEYKTSSLASKSGSAQNIIASKSTTITTEGITTLIATTTDGTNTATKEYEIKLDKTGPAITVTSSGENSYPDTLTLKATDLNNAVEYIELPNGTKITGTTAMNLTTTYNVTKNGPLTFKAVDKLGNVTTQNYTEVNVVNFETQWTTKATNTTVTVPITGTVNTYIDYGDGTKVNVTSPNPTHTYANAGTYTMKISGNCTTYGINSSTVEYLTKIVRWGCLENTTYKFGDGTQGIACKNLKGSLPSPNTYSFRKITTFSDSFNSCAGLTGSIPSGFFDSCTETTSFFCTFYTDTGLTGSIPSGLFNKCTKVTSYAGTFNGCSGLTGNIPTGLFSKSPYVTSFDYIFFKCSKLTGTIPSDLFTNNTLSTGFVCAFYGCSSINGIGSDLFATNSKATSFNQTFNGCTSMTGNLTPNMFASSNLATSFYCTFYGCKALTGSIPSTLFNACTSATDFSGTFNNCTGLSGSLSASLFKNCVKVTSFYCTFYGCKLLTSIENGFFNNNTKVTTYAGVFNQCSGITSALWTSIFDASPNVTDFSYAFYGCTNITGTAPSIWNRTNVTTRSYCFKDCTKLANYTSIPAGWK